MIGIEPSALFTLQGLNSFNKKHRLLAENGTSTSLTAQGYHPNAQIIKGAFRDGYNHQEEKKKMQSLFLSPYHKTD